MFAAPLSEAYGSIQAMPYTHEGWEWEVPAHVVSVIDGASFLADLDLGWRVHVRTIVACEGIEVKDISTPDGLAAKKEAQRLLTDAQLYLRCKRIETAGMYSVCEITYGMHFTPRSEQASFAAAMLASGYARTIP